MLPYIGLAFQATLFRCRFMNASLMYGNMKKIHAEINANPERYGVKIRFTTLSQYADHVNSLKMKFPVHRWPIDFEYGWPHVIPVPQDGPPIPPSGTPLQANTTTQYQTGAPVSRAAFKQRARQVSAIHHAAEVAHALAVAHGKMQSIETDLFPAWDGLGIVQHHDAMPGTMSTKGTFTSWGTNGQDQGPLHAGAVACGMGSRYSDTDCLALEDYFKRLSAGYNASMEVLGKALAALSSDGSAGGDLHSPEQDGSSAFITVFNPLGCQHSAVVEVKLPSALHVSARSSPPQVTSHLTGKAVMAQMKADGSALYFKVALPASGSLSFHLSKAKSSSTTQWPNVTHTAPTTPVANSAIEVSFTADGALASIKNLKDGVSVAAKQQYMNYLTNQGGPYMLVEKAAAKPLEMATSDGTGVQTVTGPIFTEVVQTFNGWGSASSTQPGPTRLMQTTRMVSGAVDVVEVMHDIPVLPMDHELISRITTDLGSETIWTDDTGFELYPRPLNHSLPISGSYHSLVNSAVMKSVEESGGSQRQLAVLSRHTMGVAALSAGELEYMMMRRISGTDNQGPWPLNETTPITVHTALLAGASKTVDRLRMRRVMEEENQPVVMYKTGGSGSSGNSSQATLGNLPAGLHLLSLYVRHPRDSGADGTELVVQLQNVVEHSQPVTLKGGLQAVLGKAVSVESCTEMTLTLQQPLASNKRMTWLAADATTGGETPAASDCCDCDLSVATLDIRSFVIKLKSQ